MITGDIVVLRPAAQNVPPGVSLPAGPAGPAGANGANGAQGPAGPAGVTQDISGKLDKAAALTATGAVVRQRDAFLNEQPATPAAFGAVGDGVANDTAALAALFARGGVALIPPGTYSCDPITISKTVQIAGSAGARIILRSMPSTDHALLRFLDTAPNSSVQGALILDGNRDVLGPIFCAFPHVLNYPATGAYSVEVKSYPLWADCAGFVCDGVTIQNAVTSPMAQFYGDYSRWTNITVINCSKLCLLQGSRYTTVRNVVGRNITNSYAGPGGTRVTIPTFQHAAELRDLTLSSVEELRLVEWIPFLSDASGVPVGDPIPSAFAFERFAGCAIQDLRAKAYTWNAADARQTGGVSFLYLSGCDDNAVSRFFGRGFAVGLLVDTCQANTFSAFGLDGAYNIAAIESVGIKLRPGGLYDVAGDVTTDYRANAGGRRNVFSAGTVNRFAVGVRINVPDGYFDSVLSDGNTVAGWQLWQNEPNATTFPNAPLQAVRNVGLVNCSGCDNGWAGVLGNDGDGVVITGGRYENNGQENGDRTIFTTWTGVGPVYASAISLFGANARNGWTIGPLDAGDTQAYTKPAGLSFAPGTTNAKNQIRASIMDADDIAVGQYILVKNGTGSADIKAKIVDIDRDLLTLQTAAPATFSGAGGNTRALAGTVSGTAGTITLTGSGTAFNTAIVGPAWIAVAGAYYRVAKVVSATQIQIVTPLAVAVPAGTVIAVVLVDLQGVPSQQSAIAVGSGCRNIAWSGVNTRGSSNVLRDFAVDDPNASLVAGQELLVQGAITNLNTGSTDTPIGPTFVSSGQWDPVSFRFQVTQAVAGASGGALSVLFGYNSGLVATAASGLAYAKNTAATGGINPTLTSPDFIYPVARVVGGSGNPTSGAVRMDVVFKRRGLPAFSAAA